MEQKILETMNLTKKIGQRLILDNLNLTIYKGDIYGFIGRNGAGKTTFIRAITGLVTVTSGIVWYGDERLVKSAIIEAPAYYANLSAYENLRYIQMQGEGKAERSIEQILDCVGLRETGNKKVKNFSLGMRQRLSLGMAIYRNPDFLILDEPINGLDPKGIVEIRNILKQINREYGTTILISSHILSELSMLATRFGIIHQGRLIREFAPGELDTAPQNRYRLWVSGVAPVLELMKAYDVPIEAMDSKGIVFAIEPGLFDRFCQELSTLDVVIYGFERIKKNLEDIFIELTREEAHHETNQG